MLIKRQSVLQSQMKLAVNYQDNKEKLSGPTNYANQLDAYDNS